MQGQCYTLISFPTPRLLSLLSLLHRSSRDTEELCTISNTNICFRLHSHYFLNRLHYSQHKTESISTLFPVPLQLDLMYLPHSEAGKSRVFPLSFQDNCLHLQLVSTNEV